MAMAHVSTQTTLSFAGILQDGWKGPRLACPESALPEATPLEWLAQYAFLGKLMGAGLVTWWRFAIWAMEEALEKERRSDWSLVCDVMASILLLEGAGDALLQACREPSHGELSVERWRYWAMRFGEVADQLRDEARRAAQLARDHMAVASTV